MFLPTYGRVKSGKLQKHLDSVTSNVDDPDHIVYTFLVNRNDKETINYLKTTNFSFQKQVLYESLSVPHLARFYNAIYTNTMFKFPDTLVSMVGDDMVWQTRGFDSIIIDMFNKHGDYCIVHCNDDYIMKGRVAVNLFTTRAMVDTCFDTFMCDDFPIDYMDTLWTDLGKMTNTLYYLDNVVLRHEHNTALPEYKRDDTYNRLRREFDKTISNLHKYRDHLENAYRRFLDAQAKRTDMYTAKTQGSV